MAKRAILEAVVLRTIDIGEADRLCILFTRERGRLAARAKSVRKLTSRMGGSILPFRHITVEISESDTYMIITGVMDREGSTDMPQSYPLFVQLEQGIELLLTLTEDDEPLPRVFDLILQFIALVHEGQADVLPSFQLRLLHLLGFLPESDEDPRYASLDEESKAFIRACSKITDLRQLYLLTPENDVLKRFMKMVLSEQLQRPLKSD